MPPDRTRRTSVAATTDARRSDRFDKVHDENTPGELEDRVKVLEIDVAKLKQRRRSRRRGAMSEPVVASNGDVFLPGSGWCRVGAA